MCVQYVCMCVWCVCVRVCVPCACIHECVFSVPVCAYCACLALRLPTRTRLAAASPRSQACGASPGLERWCRGMSQSREPQAPTSSQVHLGGTGRIGRAHLPAHRMPSLGDLGKEMGLCIIKTGRAEDPVLAVQGRVSEETGTCRLLSKRKEVGWWRGRSALETEKLRHREKWTET